MLIARAPMRISFGGGGTVLEAYYARYGGFVLGAEGGKIKEILDAYVLAPGQNTEREEDTHMIPAYNITWHMHHVVHQYARSKADNFSLHLHFPLVGVS